MMLSLHMLILIIYEESFVILLVVLVLLLVRGTGIIPVRTCCVHNKIYMVAINDEEL